MSRGFNTFDKTLYISLPKEAWYILSLIVAIKFFNRILVFKRFYDVLIFLCSTSKRYWGPVMGLMVTILMNIESTLSEINFIVMPETVALYFLTRK